MQLKNYQNNTLNVLRKFFEQARICGHKQAYENIVSEPEISYRLGKLKSPYTVWSTIPNTPRVCLKVPTGGGKTIIAAHALKIVSEMWMEREFPIVLWFTPSDTIRGQTTEALKNPRHPYREVLDEQFGGHVKVFDIDEKFNIRPADIEHNLCIVVSTIQSFTKKDTAKYNVYKHNENLEPHFTHITAQEGMERDENGQLKYSFANLLYAQRPIMIVDEAHNVVTNLNAEMQGRINPSAIIELTATPRLQNNTLYNVYATELKEEEMIKLPIALTEHNNWELAVTEAIAKRDELEKAAGHEKEYLRPILLFQAQDIKGEITVEKLKDNLINVQQIPEEQIAIATCDQKELDGVNVFDRNCPIRYIITVQALKEGWDCSFAYVLCSLANVQSDTAVEQLLGRVMRMPYAKSRSISALNKAYAYVLSPKFGVATDCIVKKLENKGFSDDEALSVIEQKTISNDLFSSNPQSNKVILKQETIIKTQDLPATIKLTRENDGVQSITFTPQTTQEDIEKVKLVLNDDSAKFELENKFANYKKEQEEPSPAKNGEKFKVPQMMVELQGELELADPEIVFEYFDWDLNDYAPYQLNENEFAITKQGNGFMIDIDNHSLKYSPTGEDQYEMAFMSVDNWTAENLVRWLDKQLRDSYFSQATMVKWLSDVVNYLIEHRGLKLAELMLAKYALANKLKTKIQTAYAIARQKSYQTSLFAPQARVELNFDNGFEFFDNMYENEICYRGRYKFSKHYLGSNNVPNFDGGVDGEEFQCAKALDSNPSVKYWIRNVARHPNSFWLPTSTDKFYPDFVAMLNDGRILVVEYKGKHLIDNADTREKKQIGELWQSKSNGKGLFLMAEKVREGMTTAEQINIKISK
ncbi:MAG: DEAD/DEAH box helicase family protein [Alphaproteobacteria bacterium]|nr:DEAD/DEAH box helicase family protein [Alphaproteobacteria bacterium]